ncbi:tRNA-dihydrouridine synthase 3 [Metarhizium rileyi]|uniref:tRNA-dihydrouridine(47) synthase [NAD(P)(+)] n=1 Tax=Metarhizium rileyi (strain RCEF 4871) TaxID=1649241 RepID=A0A5C6GE59_METRR|nr:tRNA-dihydrouridine synthase 3 [Metarhizium rileyi]
MAESVPPENTHHQPHSPEQRAAKRLKVDSPAPSKEDLKATRETKKQACHDAPTNGNGDAAPEPAAPVDRRPGLTPIKKEYLLDVSTSRNSASEGVDDDAAEGRGDARDARDGRDNHGGARGKKGKKEKKKKGQNTERSFGRFGDSIQLCNSRAMYPEFSPHPCKFGDKCRMCHDLRRYLDEGRREDVETFGGKCPVFEQYGVCFSGWKCRFVKSHMKELEHEDGRKELVLIDSSNKTGESGQDGTLNGTKSSKVSDGDDLDERRAGIHNNVAMSTKIDLNRKRIDFTKADEYIKWMNDEATLNNEFHHRRKDQSNEGIEDLRAQFVDPPFKPSEKRRLYFGPETPTLAPLTTQGNLPFRRLCVELGCELTYSEMAMGMPLLQGTKADWTLLKAHESETQPPRFNPSGSNLVFDSYDNSRDLRFGAQISGNQPWVVTKAADVLNRYCPRLRLIDLNCGCPIDMIFKSGGGSALLESQGKLERMVRGMNAMSGEIPITAKIRTGVKSSRPTAPSVISKLAFGSREHRERLGAPGCAALTLHGRSREQRYTKRADWSYIGECAALIKSYNEQKDALADTAADPDASTLANAKDGRMYFLGNGDCYSHTEYFEHISKSHVDTVMIGRGALIKPWLFEEIQQGQYLDKSSSERLTYIEKFVRYGLDAWGSDELGIGFTRRFLLEWLSFAHRYVPVGLLEVLPPSLNDRPPAYVGRNDLETLMASGNYKDWIKLTEMFLGPVHPGFEFQPKHRSNAYEAEG